MPICIECSYPVSHLYSAYSRADDRSQGKGVRLTQCPRCQRFADKYVEYDFVVIFIDLVLIKPQVYRHLLFNRLGRDDNRFDRSIVRLGILLLLFDVYLNWARLERHPSLSATFLARAPIVIQYLFFLTLNAAATLAHHLTVRLLASLLVSTNSRRDGLTETTPSTATTADTTPFPSGPPTPTMKPLSSSPAGNIPAQQQQQQALPSAAAPPSNPSSSEATPTADQPPPPPPQQQPAPLRRASTAPPQNIQPLPPPTAASPTAISTALLVSSCAKLFPILLVIWGADVSSSSSSSVADSGTRKDLGASKAALSSNRDALSSPSFLESSLAAAESSLRPYLPTGYVTGLFGVLASLLSLGVVDTHLVLLSNIEALYILLGCGYLRAVAVAVWGQVARWAVQKAILGAVGVR